MNKIGIITIYSVPNFGSVLQAFASQVILEKLGYDPYIIKYKFPNEFHGNKESFKEKIKKVIYRIGITKNHRKVKNLDRFKNTKFKFTKSYESIEDLKNEDWTNYRALIVGSDQVWNSRFVFGDKAFMLSFAPDKIKKISLASSFAQKKIQDNYLEKYKKYLSRFSALSVREENGINIINKQLAINKNVIVCLDPTLLIDKDDWLNIIPRSHFKKKKPYILLYMWAYAFEPRPYIFDVLLYFQKKLDYDIIALEGFDYTKGIRNKLKIIDATDSTISDFIDYFNQADLVVTSSFHGTAFSLNFSRPLISIVPNNSGDDRQSAILRKLGAENCIINIGEDIETINPYYDTKKVSYNLRIIRENNINWITKNLE